MENQLATTKTFLHVGCGAKSKNATPKGLNNAQWTEVRLDINPAVQPDIIGTMTDMSAVPSASMDAVFSSHNIEHLYPHEVPVALAEFHRTLKDDGFAVITCPDLASVCKQVGEGRLTDPLYVSPAGPISALDILYGFRKDMENGNLYMAHRGGFVESSLRDVLLAAGFKSVATLARPEHYDLWAIASKDTLDGDALASHAAQYFFI